MRRGGFLIPVLIVALVVVLSSIFIVDEREKVLVLRFGQIKQVRTDAGLGFKLPLLDEVVRFDDRILSLETELIEVTPADDRRLEVDAFVLYRIGDIVQFRQALGADGVRQAQIQLAGILDGQIRAVLGAQGVTSNTILSPERAALMEQIRELADSRAEALGLDIVDVRLRQTNLPEQNFDATLQRMIAEREREATDERARGREAAQRVTALADRTYEEILSEARRDARIIEGEADAERNRIFADAYTKNSEFFEFYRSLTAYEQALKGENSSMVLSPDSEFFNYLRSDQGARSAEGELGARRGTQGGSRASVEATSASSENTAEETTAADTPGTDPVGNTDGAVDGDASETGNDDTATDTSEGDAATDPATQSN
ncbi:protease modulator HflC [Sulfitobacter sp. D35]|uniref:protease modulator HflC n=1 Tax=Sulfitobacter sp. D35 TaxID=3083252 RepID=UPI002970030E|nr:protease modulator HflC [Sulfitobacter sp. D35]MDW4499848.1 protease modulator HflC [Sulfitobacter sp. D35]